MKEISPELARHKRLLENKDALPSMYINDISKLFGHLMSRDCDSEGLSIGYRRMFRILCEQDGITQVELAKRAKLSTPSVSTALGKMEQDGLVRRETDMNDRRKVFVYITEKGREQDEFIRSRCHRLDDIMMRGISEEDKARLNTVLRQILVNMLEEGDN